MDLIERNIKVDEYIKKGAVKPLYILHRLTLFNLPNGAFAVEVCISARV